jgi:hypothetical protein
MMEDKMPENSGKSCFDAKVRTGFTETPEVREIMSKYQTDKAYGGIVTFEGLTVNDAARLLELLPEFQKEDKQNDSPSFEEFVELGKDYPSMTFHGYRVTSERSDERITIEGFCCPTKDVTKKDLGFFAGMHSDEYDVLGEGDQEYVRLWWD